MKTIFKTSLVALAVAGAAFNASAVTISGTQNYSLEGLKSVTGTAVRVTVGSSSTTTSPTFTFGEDIPANGLVRISFNVPFAATSNFSYTAPADLFTGAGVNLKLANQGADFVVYRAQALVAGADTLNLNSTTFAAGNPVPAPASGLKFMTADLVKVKSLVAVVSTENVVGQEQESAELEVAKIVRKRTFAVDGTTGVVKGTIDVAERRTAFTAGSYQGLTTTVAAGAAGAFAFDVAYKAATYTLKGDFSWVKDTDTASTGIQDDDVVLVTGAGCSKDSLTATELKVVCDYTTNTNGPAVNFDLDANTASKPNEKVAAVIPAQSFVLNGTVEYANVLGTSSNKESVFADLAVGSWSLNGSDVTIPYMVYGNVGGKDYNQVIQLTNKSAIEGAIYVDIYDGEGKAIAKDKKLTVAAKANSVTNIATDIKAIIAEAKYAGKVSVRVIAEVPSATAQIYAAYQDVATSERAIVVGLKN